MPAEVPVQHPQALYAAHGIGPTSAAEGSNSGVKKIHFVGSDSRDHLCVAGAVQIRTLPAMARDCSGERIKDYPIVPLAWAIVRRVQPANVPRQGWVQPIPAVPVVAEQSEFRG